MTVSSKKLEPVFMRIKTSVLYLVPIKRYLGNRGVLIIDLKIHTKLWLVETGE